MKPTAIIIILLCATTAHAEWFTWDKDNTVLHVPLTMTYIVDYKQTIKAQRITTPDNRDWIINGHHHEENRFMSKHPSRGEIDRYFISAYLINTALVYILPAKWSHALQAGTIGFELMVIDNNINAGLRINF